MVNPTGSKGNLWKDQESSQVWLYLTLPITIGPVIFRKRCPGQKTINLTEVRPGFTWNAHPAHSTWVLFYVPQSLPPHILSSLPIQLFLTQLEFGHNLKKTL